MYLNKSQVFESKAYSRTAILRAAVFNISSLECYKYDTYVFHWPLFAID